jgi:hypothetical protein
MGRIMTNSITPEMEEAARIAGDEAYKRWTGSDRCLDGMTQIARAILSAALAHPGPVREIGTEQTELVDRLTRPIIGIENRTALEAFDIMSDRIRSALALPLPVQEPEPKSEWPHLIQMARTLGLFASVIKSGEPWSPTCQTEYELANAACKEAWAEFNSLSSPSIREVVRHD